MQYATCECKCNKKWGEKHINLLWCFHRYECECKCGKLIDPATDQCECKCEYLELSMSFDIPSQIGNKNDILIHIRIRIPHTACRIPHTMYMGFFYSFSLSPSARNHGRDRQGHLAAHLVTAPYREPELLLGA